MNDTHFSIISPSFNMLGYLKRCSSSVLDQEGVIVEHIVIDGKSTDGTANWLKNNNRIISVSEKDNGMYEAINKGLRMAKGEIIAYLNCDEQYLQGTLSYVQKYFNENPNIDIIFGGVLLIKPNGELIAYRKAYHPRWLYIDSSHLYVLSCGMFLKKKIINSGFYFDEKIKVIADKEFVVRLLKHKFKAAYVKRYLSAFTITGNNLSNGQKARLEIIEESKKNAKIIKYLRYPINAARLTEKLLSGAYCEIMPLVYSVYASDEDCARTMFTVWKSSFRWPKVL